MAGSPPAPHARVPLHLADPPLGCASPPDEARSRPVPRRSGTAARRVRRDALPQDATLVFNDWAAPQLLVAEALTARISGMILVACETAGNYPPGLPGKNLALLGAIPGALRFALAAMRLPVIRRTPVTLGGWPSMRCQMISSGSGCAGRGATRRSFEM